MEAQYYTAIQKSIIVSVLMAYNGINNEIEQLNDITLDEKYFNGYFQAIVKARNILLKESPIVNDFMVEDFLVQRNYFDSKKWVEIITTIQLPFSVLVWYYERLKDEYVKRLAL